MEHQDYNRLKEEKSAYLRQHQDNPVYWWAYGPEAIQRAQEENLPIFLSVGYSSCHWCHVMAHESFENQEVADFLNKNFVCIKVDREEFPDLDHYYQQACQIFSHNGGWPLSSFLLPDMRPFFVGTYFPPGPRQGAPSFMEVIKELKRAYSEEHEKIKDQAQEVTQKILDGLIPKEKIDFQGHFPPPIAIMEAIKQFSDTEHGGYGEAPKFPQFAFYEWAIEQMLDGMIEKDLGEHIITSIEKMLMGGISDHCRGGIHRYSVDATWTVPHFEKMLYDQAGLLRLCAKFSLIYPSPLVYDCLMNTLDYLDKEMIGEDDYFFSSQDADSEGEEGLFFTYSLEEFEEIIIGLNDENIVDQKEKIKDWFNISKEGNFAYGLNVISLNPDKREGVD